MFMHVPISAKLAHFLLKHSKQIHILEKKARDKKLWCHSSAILRPWRVFLSINWIDFFLCDQVQVESFDFHLLFFLFRSGASNLWPTSQNFFVRPKLDPEFFGILIIFHQFFFWQTADKTWEKSELRLREKLWIERPWFRLRALKSSIWRRTLSAVSWN